MITVLFVMLMLCVTALLIWVALGIKHTFWG
jgi:hypothetical protein